MLILKLQKKKNYTERHKVENGKKMTTFTSYVEKKKTAIIKNNKKKKNSY